MTLRNKIKGALLATSVVALTACGRTEPFDPAVFDAEVHRLAEEGDMYGEIFLVLKESRPSLYNEFRSIAVREFVRGRSTRQSSYQAGMQMREKFLTEILQLSRIASDEHVKDILDVTIDTMTHLQGQNVTDCVRSIEGLPPKKMDKYPSELRKREMQLITDLLGADKSMSQRRAASEKEVLNWMLNLASANPDIADMFRLMEVEKRSAQEDKIVCDGMITVYKRLSYKSAEKRGTLFRGMALMALRQKQLERLENTGNDTAG